MSVNMKNQREHKFSSVSKRIDCSLCSNITLNLEGKRFGDWLTLHMNVVIYATLFNIFIFIFLGKSPHTFYRQEKHAFNLQYEVKRGNRIPYPGICVA